jgi:hypothetical protein
MSRQSIQLVLTVQERSALSAALHTLLNLWGDSEDAGQARIHSKLRSIAAKLEALDPERTDGIDKRDAKPIAQGIHSSGNRARSALTTRDGSEQSPNKQ